MQGINNKKFVENRIKSTNFNRFCVDFIVQQKAPSIMKTNGGKGQMFKNAGKAFLVLTNKKYQNTL